MWNLQRMNLEKKKKRKKLVFKIIENLWSGKFVKAEVINRFHKVSDKYAIGYWDFIAVTLELEPWEAIMIP